MNLHYDYSGPEAAPLQLHFILRLPANVYLIIIDYNYYLLLPQH